MSDHFLEEEIFFESDPEPNFDFAEKSVRNESEQHDYEKPAHAPCANTVGQKNKYINRIKSLTPV